MISAWTRLATGSWLCRTTSPTCGSLVRPYERTCLEPPAWAWHLSSCPSLGSSLKWTTRSSCTCWPLFYCLLRECRRQECWRRLATSSVSWYSTINLPNRLRSVYSAVRWSFQVTWRLDLSPPAPTSPRAGRPNEPCTFAENSLVPRGTAVGYFTVIRSLW